MLFRSFSVKNYGEFEFWFALIKVVAIIGFVILGILAILKLQTGIQVSTRCDGARIIGGCAQQEWPP